MVFFLIFLYLAEKEMVGLRMWIGHVSFDLIWRWGWRWGNGYVYVFTIWFESLRREVAGWYATLCF